MQDNRYNYYKEKLEEKREDLKSDIQIAGSIVGLTALVGFLGNSILGDVAIGCALGGGVLPSLGSTAQALKDAKDYLVALKEFKEYEEQNIQKKEELKKEIKFETPKRTQYVMANGFTPDFNMSYTEGNKTKDPIQYVKVKKI